MYYLDFQLWPIMIYVSFQSVKSWTRIWIKITWLYFKSEFCQKNSTNFMHFRFNFLAQHNSQNWSINKYYTTIQLNNKEAYFETTLKNVWFLAKVVKWGQHRRVSFLVWWEVVVVVVWVHHRPRVAGALVELQLLLSSKLLQDPLHCRGQNKVVSLVVLILGRESSKRQLNLEFWR